MFRCFEISSRREIMKFGRLIIIADTLGTEYFRYFDDLIKWGLRGGSDSVETYIVDVWYVLYVFIIHLVTRLPAKGGY